MTVLLLATCLGTSLTYDYCCDYFARVKVVAVDTLCYFIAVIALFLHSFNLLSEVDFLLHPYKGKVAMRGVPFAMWIS